MQTLQDNEGKFGNHMCFYHSVGTQNHICTFPHVPCSTRGKHIVETRLSVMAAGNPLHFYMILVADFLGTCTMSFSRIRLDGSRIAITLNCLAITFEKGHKNLVRMPIIISKLWWDWCCSFLYPKLSLYLPLCHLLTFSFSFDDWRFSGSFSILSGGIVKEKGRTKHIFFRVWRDHLIVIRKSALWYVKGNNHLSDTYLKSRSYAYWLPVASK